MSSGDYTTSPRCGQPVTRYDKPGRTDEFPVCWRPAGHPGTRHRSRWAYLRELEGSLRRKRKRREMTVAAGRMRA